jgi:hypothetical protein
LINLDTSVNVHDGTITNPGIVAAGNPLTTVAVESSIGTMISGVQSSNSAGVTSYNTYGLYVDSASSGTNVGANRFLAQTGQAYSIADATAGSIFGGNQVFQADNANKVPNQLQIQGNSNTDMELLVG